MREQVCHIILSLDSLYLRNIAVDDAVHVVHYELIQLHFRDVIEGSVPPGEATARLLEDTPPVLLSIQGIQIC